MSSIHTFCILFTLCIHERVIMIAHVHTCMCTSFCLLVLLIYIINLEAWKYIWHCALLWCDMCIEVGTVSSVCSELCRVTLLTVNVVTVLPKFVFVIARLLFSVVVTDFGILLSPYGMFNW